MRCWFVGVLFAALVSACGGDGGKASDADAGGESENECASGTHDCHENATCTDTADGYECECNDGFEGDGTTCDRVLDCPASSLEYGGECLRLSAAGNHACLARDGVLRCWGDNTFGQLGTGDLAPRESPTRVGSEDDWTYVATSFTHSCAIRAPGTLWCWGLNSPDHLLGTPDATDTTVPIQIGTEDDWLQVSTTESHTCAVKTGGTLHCWGYNTWGELGLGEGQSATELVRQVGTDSDWVQVAVSGDPFFGGASCARKASGSVYCWGSDEFAIQGNGEEATGSVWVPEQMTDFGTVVDLVPGVSAMCAITADDTAYCWGLNDDGQLGTGPTIVHSPTAVTGRYVAIAPRRSTCAIGETGDLYCWGENDFGERGTGDRGGPQGTPVKADDSREWLQVTGGLEFACGLADDGAGKAVAYCWGRNQYGNLGIGHPGVYPLPTKVPGTWKSVSAAGAQTCAIAGDDSLWCWGANYYHQLGLARPTVSEQVPFEVAAGTSWHSVSAGGNHACAIERLDGGGYGGAYCWGRNDDGQLGVGDEATRSTPTQVGTAEDWRRISSGSSHSCAILGGELFCWGQNGGRLGNGSSASSSNPVQVSVSQDGEAWADVSAGDDHTCGSVEVSLQQGGTEFRLYCFGNDSHGELGNGPNEGSSLTPDLIASGAEWDVSIGANYSCGFDDGAQLSCWGYNNYGQLGVGDSDSRSEPTVIADPSGWNGVSAGFAHTCGLVSLGGIEQALYCFGRNQEGQLGIGTVTGLNVVGESLPVRVGTASDWTSVSAGGSHTCAINLDSELYCWGGNEFGQLGLGTHFRDQPTAIAEDL